MFGGHQSGHVKRRTDARATTSGSSLAVPLTAITRMSGQTTERVKLLVWQVAQFGQFGNPHPRRYRSATWHALQTLICFAPQRQRKQQLREIAFALVKTLLQPADMGFQVPDDSLAPLLLRLLQTKAFGGEHLDQLGASVN